MIYAKRMSDYAAELAEKETNPKRKAELLKISEVNAKVPAQRKIGYSIEYMNPDYVWILCADNF